MPLSPEIDIFNKCKNYTRVRDAINAGVYVYFRPIERISGNKVFRNGKWLLSVASNDYLGLTQHPKVIEASINAIKEFGTSCAGSRFLNGTLRLHIELEEKIAKLYNKESVLVFSTGFFANLGAISSLGGRHDMIFCDRENHASILDGCRLAFAKTLKYQHNNIADLERLLSETNDNHGKLIVVDGVFSMSGDICDLPAIVPLCEKYNARIMVDEAHGIGVLGKRCLGTVEHFGVMEGVDIIMGTFSKTLASVGGFIASSKEAVTFIKHTSREMIFTAALPPPSVAAVLAALDILGSETEKRDILIKNVEYVSKGFKDLGFRIGENLSAIVPIYIGGEERTYRMIKMLEEEGVYANVVVSPAVPPGDELIRTSYKATHTKEDLDFVLDKFKKVGKAMSVI